MRISDWSSDGCSSDLFWLLPECFASLAGFVTPEGGTPGMARRQHVLSGPRSGEAEQAAFQALCHAKQEKFAAAYTACNQALQISEDLPDPTCLIVRSEEHTSELQSIMRISYAVFCLEKKQINH